MNSAEASPPPEDAQGTITPVESPTPQGTCPHVDADKILLGQGEYRPQLSMDVTLPDGRVEKHYYNDESEPLTYVITTLCSECGTQEVYKVDEPIDTTPAPQPVPPPQTVDVSNAERFEEAS